MEKNNKNLNVPNLRFPEFSGEWENKRIDEIAPLQRGFDLPTQDVEDGDYPVVYSNGILKYHKTYKCEAPGLVTGRSGSIGSFTYISDGKYWPHNTSLWVTDFKNNYPPFIYYLYQTINISQYASGSSVPTLNRNDVHRHITYLPTFIEQVKIAKLLVKIDERIDTQRKIIEDLKKLKDAIAEKLFCAPEEESPELRIVNSSDRWISYRLKDVCQRVSERNSQGLSSLVLTIAAQYGLVSQTDFFNKSVASENLSNYYLIQKGDFAYNKSYSGEYVWGAVKRLELYEKGVLSPLYICFRPNPLIVNSDFLSHYFETHKWHNGIAQIAGEGARNHGLLNVSISDYFATLHRLPGLAEQKKIASYLNLLSDKISLANKELQCYSRQKQYLLARMFI